MFGAFFVGPNGGRAFIEIYISNPGRAGLQRSWEDLGQVFDSFSQDYLPDFNFSREDELQREPFAAGCADARRIDGVDETIRLPIGITVCAVDPDINIFAVVIGEMGGIGDYEASGRLVTLALEAVSGPD